MFGAEIYTMFSEGFSTMLLGISDYFIIVKNSKKSTFQLTMCLAQAVKFTPCFPRDSPPRY